MAAVPVIRRFSPKKDSWANSGSGINQLDYPTRWAFVGDQRCVVISRNHGYIKLRLVSGSLLVTNSSVYSTAFFLCCVLA